MRAKVVKNFSTSLSTAASAFEISFERAFRLMSLKKSTHSTQYFWTGSEWGNFNVTFRTVGSHVSSAQVVRILWALALSKVCYSLVIRVLNGRWPNNTHEIRPIMLSDSYSRNSLEDDEAEPGSDFLLNFSVLDSASNGTIWYQTASAIGIRHLWWVQDESTMNENLLHLKVTYEI